VARKADRRRLREGKCRVRVVGVKIREYPRR
jgi:hypothetical protein